MAINRFELVSHHNPYLTEPDLTSPMTIGNGEIAFTADVTGFQTLYKEYTEILPLCTQSQWGWHTEPVSAERYDYTLKDLVMSEYDYLDRKVYYPKKRMPGNEEVYDWLRKNPHRLNLGRIGLVMNGEEISVEDVSDIKQELKLYEGGLYSEYSIKGASCKAETFVDSETDTIAFKLCSELLKKGELAVRISFPYGSPDISASNWECPERHTTEVSETDEGAAKLLSIKRTLDRDVYYVKVLVSNGCKEVKAVCNEQYIDIYFDAAETALSVSFFEGAEVQVSKEQLEAVAPTVAIENSKLFWKNYWEKGGIVSLRKSKDKRAEELERRIILSQYLMAVNSLGSAPPQETGLTCNSWYGKMHLEMYFWHCAWAPLWKHTDLLERSLKWYLKRIPEAQENASRNKYKGSRWPKMIAGEGIDCPSAVAPLLVWQQPHIIFMLELARRQNNDKEFMKKYYVLIKETAEFMVDIVALNKETGRYDIVPPVIPVQECHKHDITRNPTFEVEYWKYTLKLALEWAAELGEEADPKWAEVADKMAELPTDDKYYLAHAECPDTFEEYNRDHPSMLMAYGVIPSDRVEEDRMERTLDKILECWKYQSLWGWDFAVMAMTATRLGQPEKAIDILLMDTFKNCYVRSGNNRQISRKDLPLYLPGNGSLLLAIALMAGGYEGCDIDAPGFPKNGEWTVEVEDIERYV